MVSRLYRKARLPNGFTLLELLVVLTIAGLLAALVPPLYAKAVPGARLKTTARIFAISLRDARATAVTTGKHVDLKLIADPPSYSVDNDAGIQLPRGVSMTAYDYLTVANISLTNANARSEDEFVVRFFPDGSSNGAVIKLSNGSTAYRVNVSWLIGDIQIFRIEDRER